jgi:hypothetical protein
VTGKDRIQLKSDRLKLQNDARTALLQGLGGLLVLTGAGFGAAATLRQVRETRHAAQLSDERARDQLDQARQQLELAREQGRRSDKWTRRQLAILEEA